MEANQIGPIDCVTRATSPALDEVAEELYRRLSWIQDDDVLQSAVCWGLQKWQDEIARVPDMSIQRLIFSVRLWLKRGRIFNGIRRKLTDKHTEEAKDPLSEVCRRLHGVRCCSMDEPLGEEDSEFTLHEVLPAKTPPPYHQARRRLDWARVLNRLAPED